MGNNSSRGGHYEKIAEYNYFIPSKLPPEIKIDQEMMELYGEAMLSLGKFAEAQTRIPSKRRFLHVYVAKEAIFSSQIENINTTLPQVLEYKSKERSENEDVQEVLNYIEALNFGDELMTDKNLPVSSRLIRECHKKLLSGVRGENKTPGHYRKVPVFVGELVPPPAHYIEDLIYNLEKFINENNSLLPLLRVGLTHVQFETIHPFLDGNGRIGRLLIVLMMMDYKLINEPVLYPSIFFMKNRSEYYSRLDAVRLKGDYEGWIKFFLRGIKTSADDIVKRAWKIDSLLKDYSYAIANQLPRVRKNAEKLLEQLCETPIMTINDVMDLIGTSYATAQKLVNSFIELDILKHEDQKQRNKAFVLWKYLNILEKDVID